jgi:ribonucleoside-diphosphate reductase alpha chain
MSAMAQLHYWYQFQSHWCDHNASSTIYVSPDEWGDVETFVHTYWDSIGGLSFLPRDDHKYENAPYEEINEEEYQRRLAALPATLDLGSLVEAVDNSTLSRDAACVGGFCEF